MTCSPRCGRRSRCSTPPSSIASSPGRPACRKLMSTRDVIRHATVDGARVAGLGAVTGSLEPGKQADIVVLRTDRPNIFPINDPIGAVVWGMDTSNVDWVFVGRQAADARRRPRSGRRSRPATSRRRPSSGWPPPSGSPSAPRRGVSDETRRRRPPRRRSRPSSSAPATCRCTSHCSSSSSWRPSGPRRP